MTLLDPRPAAEKETLMAPYDAMAPVYEAFVGPPERHAPWLAGMIALAGHVGVTGGTALDVGCGTGRSMLALREAGFDARGIDPSRKMMDVARERLGADARLDVGALPDLPPGPPADLVTAFNDAVNYVPPAQLAGAIASLAASVKPGGALVFDTNAPLTYSTFFGTTFCRSTPGLFLVWESLGADEDGGFAADLHAFEEDPAAPGRWRRSISHHRQYLHPHEAVAGALAAAGLELVRVEAQRDSGPRDPDFDEAIHSKRIYLATRP